MNWEKELEDIWGDSISDRGISKYKGSEVFGMVKKTVKEASVAEAGLGRVEARRW